VGRLTLCWLEANGNLCNLGNVDHILIDLLLELAWFATSERKMCK